MRKFVALIASVLLVLGVFPARPAAAAETQWWLENVLSGWCLQGKGPQQPVVMDYCANDTTGVWYLRPVAGPVNDYTIRNGEYPNQCLDQHYGSNGSTATTLLRMWPCSGVSNQTWVIEPPTDRGNTIRNARSRWCLDQSHTNNNTVPTSTVVAYPCHYQRNQQWLNY
ncbi:RICIN domain-containing protein [Paractinoplanes lichenicola]|uniref:RICIN domain-containing protein n=1 Tax=Paractinoplanes lichenicola TaxID=2802976 RepID=A0ABS1VWE5_9ACTN|nr:RICIN domain-containing protein [Actinoplanes lichenicola]MBL7258648.1 RICIN domain-containing protein [Actinoplanes lichenicola]